MLYFEVKVRYDKMQDNGLLKKTVGIYVVNAYSFAEAEKRITENVSRFIGDFSVCAEKIANFSEVLFSKDSMADFWYKIRIEVLNPNEKTGKIKKSYLNFLVQAASVDGAKKTISEYLKDSMMDWKIYSVSETKITDVFFYN